MPFFGSTTQVSQWAKNTQIMTLCKIQNHNFKNEKEKKHEDFLGFFSPGKKNQVFRPLCKV